MPQYFQLHGLWIRALSDRPPIKRLLHRALQFKGAEHVGEERLPASGAVDITLDFSVDRDPASPAEDARHIDMTGHPGTGIWRTSEQMILYHRDTTVGLYPQTGVAEAAIPPDLLVSRADQRLRSLFSHLVAISLAILLRAHDWFPLHAAGLAHEGRGVLLTAHSGSGKSTSALSLVRSGWGYVSDDTVLLRSEDDRVNAYSFRRNFCVEPSTAAHFPELDGPEWPSAPSNASKWEVDLSQIYPGRSTALCTPYLVVLPDLADRSESRVEPVGTKTALEQLLNQGGFFLAPRSDAADQHLTVLRRLLDQSRTYRLHAGRDVLETSHALHDLLAPLLEDAAL